MGMIFVAVFGILVLAYWRLTRVASAQDDVDMERGNYGAVAGRGLLMLLLGAALMLFCCAGAPVFMP